MAVEQQRAADIKMIRLKLFVGIGPRWVKSLRAWMGFSFRAELTRLMIGFGSVPLFRPYLCSCAASNVSSYFTSFGSLLHFDGAPGSDGCEPTQKPVADVSHVTRPHIPGEKQKSIYVESICLELVLGSQSHPQVDALNQLFVLKLMRLSFMVQRWLGNDNALA